MLPLVPCHTIAALLCLRIDSGPICCKRHCSAQHVKRTFICSLNCFFPLSLLCMLCQVAELLVGVAAPVLYWEQGHEWLFGDPVRSQVRLGSHNKPCDSEQS